MIWGGAKGFFVSGPYPLPQNHLPQPLTGGWEGSLRGGLGDSRPPVLPSIAFTVPAAGATARRPAPGAGRRLSRGLGVGPGPVSRGPGVVENEGHRLNGVGAQRQGREVVAEHQEAKIPQLIQARHACGPTTLASKSSMAWSLSFSSPLWPASSGASTWTKTRSISRKASKAAATLPA